MSRQRPQVRRMAALPQVDVRFDAADTALVAPLAAAATVAPPRTPNTAATAPDGAGHWLWLGPDEWLVVGEGAADLRLPDGAGSLVDLSANRVVLELRGPGARDVLAAGCALDLHPRAVGPGRCAQTLLARAAVILEQTSEEPAYRIYVRPSFAGYLTDWLRDAAPALESAGATPSPSP